MNASWEIIWKTDETKQKTQKEKPEEDEQTEDRATVCSGSGERHMLVKKDKEVDPISC